MEHLYEHRGEPMISRREFAQRVGRHFLVALVVILISLGLGILGYHLLARFSWIDSFLNASMLLGGMGPVGDIASNAGKLFAGIYALYAGLILIAASAIILTPVLHRLLHRLHVEGGAKNR
jgi:hypothetical protein